MDLLGLFRKSSTTVRAIVMMDGGSPQTTPRNYSAMAREGYEWCVTAYACVRDISDAVAGIKWKLYRRRGSNKTEIDNHPLLDLIRKPNPYQAWPDFIRNDTSYYLLAGNSYIEAVGVPKKIEDPASPLAKAPKELWGIRPDRIKVIPGDDALERKYEYNPKGAVYYFDRTRILHRKTFHPNNDYYGLSPLEPAGLAIDTDNAAGKWNLHLLQNNARPSGILMVKGNLTDEQFKRLQDQFEQRYKGPENAGRPFIFEAKEGGDWKQVSMSAADMDFLNGRKMSKREICQAFGWPSELVGDNENKTYSNYQEARKAAYTETILPYCDSLRDALNGWLVPFFDASGKIFLDYDKDDIEALQEDRQKKIEAARGLFDSGIVTANEARKMIGLEDTTDEFGDVRLIPFSKMPVEDLMADDEPADPAAPPSGDEDPAQEDQDQDDQARTATMAEEARARVFGIKAINLETETARVQYWKSIDRQRAAWERKATGIFTRQLKADYKAIAARARDAATSEAILTAADQVLREHKDDWLAAFRSIYQAVIPDFGKRTRNELKAKTTQETKADDEGVIWDDSVSDYLAEYGAVKVVQVTETTKKNIRRIVDAGHRDGASVDEIASAIADEEDMTMGRGRRIARTEIIQASNYGAIEGARSTGLPLRKEWLSTRDDKTRTYEDGEYDHLEADGQVTDLDGSFEVSEEKLDYPGDSSMGATAGNVINCRCTVAFITEDNQ